MAFPLSPANNQTALVNGIVYQWNAVLGVWKRNGSLDSITAGQAVLTSQTKSTSNTSGTLIVAGGVGITGNLYASNVYITGPNGIVFPDGTVQTTAGVAVDAFARSTANSASSNTVVLQGVDNTQNTNITIATNAATAAFAQANATAGGLTSANTRLTIIEGVDVSQNTRMSIIEGVDATQNTNITAADIKAQAAFDTANTKFSSSGGTITGDTVVTGNLTVTGTQFYANTVNLTVVDNIITLNSNVTGAPTLSAGIEVNRGSFTNTKLLWSEANTAWEFTNNGTTYDKIAGLTYANAAFDQANVTAGGLTTANTRLTIIEGVDVGQNTRMSVIEGVDAGQNTRMSIIEGVDATQNASITILQGVDVTQNTNITAADTKAQGAFDKANSANVLAQAAFDAANTAGGADTFARQTANAAFTQANTATTLAQAAFDQANTANTTANSRGGVNTTGPNPPASGNTIGDIWYSTSDDVAYRYTYDGTSYYWIDISGGTIVANTAASSLMTLNKTIGVTMVFGG